MTPPDMERPLSPHERAGKICGKLFLGCSIECKLDPNFKEIEWVAAQIEEAERAAVSTYLLKKIGEANVDSNAARLAKPMTEEEISKSDIRFGEGHGPARREATNELAERIRKMEVDK